MSAMFLGAIAFNQPLDMWDVGDVRRIDKMFHNAVSFDLSRAPRLYRERVQPEHLGGRVKHYNRYSRSPK
jgi:hypothetical protein